MLRPLCFVLCCALTACGDGTQVTGSLGGVRYTTAEAIFAVVDAAPDPNISAPGPVGIVLLSSTPGTCSALAAGNSYASTAWTLAFLYNRPEDNSISFDVGAYALQTPDVIEAQAKAGNPRPQRVGYGAVYTFDASCRADNDSPYTITQGVAGVSSIAPNSSIKFDFDITSDANDRLTGHITASYCAALGALFDGSASTQTTAAVCLQP